MAEKLDRSTIIGMGFTEGERQDNSCVRDQLSGRDLMPPRTSDDLDWSDSLELRARVTRAGDRKTADILTAAARRWRQDQATIAMLRTDVTRLKGLVAELVDAAKAAQP